MTHPPHWSYPRPAPGDSVLPGLPDLSGHAALQGVLDVLAAPVVVVDAETLSVLAVSRGLQARVHARADELVGHGLLDVLVRREEQFAVQSAVRTARDHGATTLRASLRSDEVEALWTCHLVPHDELGPARLVLHLTDEEEPRRTPEVDTREATVLTDLVGVVTAVSEGIQTLVGRTADELVGRPFPLDLFDAEQLARRAEAAEVPVGLTLLLLDPTKFDRRQNRQVDLGELDRRSGRREQPGPGERSVDWTVVHPDGRKVVAAVRVSHVRDAAGDLVGYRATASDVTEERRTHQLLVSAVIREREAVRRLAELDQIQRDFIGRASHELRTPLTSMLGYTELLFEAGDGLTVEDRQMLEAIARNAGRLNSLVEDLLVLSRAQALTTEAPTETVDLSAVLRGARDLLGPLTEERELVVWIDVPDRRIPVGGDAAQLERVVVNLVSNAVKYTPDGGEVGCSLEVEEGRAVFVVSDTGIGMSESDIEQVFTPFYRTGAVEADRIRGTGLGLAIVRQIVERHRGEISVVSIEGLGSTFTVSLPLVQG